jgi:hypothetical protein
VGSYAILFYLLCIQIRSALLVSHLKVCHGIFSGYESNFRFFIELTLSNPRDSRRVEAKKKYGGEVRDT